MRRIDPTALENQLYGRGFLEGANVTELRAITDVFRALLRAKYIIVAAAVLGSLTAFLIVRNLEEEFTSSAQVMIDTRVQVEGGIRSSDTILPISLTSLESEAEVLRSLDLVERVVDALGLQDDPEFAPEDEIVALAQVDGDAEGGDNGTLSGVLDTAQSLVSGLISDAPTTDGETGLDDTAETDVEDILYKEKVIQAVAQQLDVQQLSSVSAVYTISFTSVDREKAARIANAFAEQYLASQMQTKLDTLDRSTNWLTGRAEELNTRLAELNTQLEAHLLESPFPSEEELVNAQMQRGRLRARLSQAQASGAAEADLSQTEASLAVLEGALAEQGAFEAEAARLESEIQVTQSIYSNVVAQLSVMQQQDDILRTDAQIISAARPAVWPSFPNRNQFMALGGVIGLLLACLITAIVELRRRNLRTVSDFEETTGLPVISLMPKSKGRETPLRTLMRGRTLRDDRLLKSARKLRSSIGATGLEQRSIAIVSAFPGEGKSSTALLLAKACAQTGERTLLLDVDFWRSPYRRAVRRGGPDLNELITAPEQIDEHLLALGENLDILPAFPNTENPSDLPYSRQFDIFLKHLRATYDRIVIDMPPVLPMLDFATMANAADVTLLVVRWNSTPKSAVKSAIRTLQDVGVTPIAVVPTLVEAKKAHSYSDDAFSYADKRYHAGYAK
ncbi:GumC family protein [Amaricoccus macauensis]|uniref:GumC family protein n=1 Tax=Amaricoccus macauensis TaxID=57001 RepID=UPI003C7C7FB4